MNDAGLELRHIIHMNNKQWSIGTKLKSSMLKEKKRQQKKKAIRFSWTQNSGPTCSDGKNGRNSYLGSNRPKSNTSLSSGFISNFSLNNSVFNFGNNFGRSRSSSPQRAMNKQCMAVLDINACRWTMNHSVICNKNEIYQWNMFKSCFTVNYKEFPTRL